MVRFGQQHQWQGEILGRRCGGCRILWMRQRIVRVQKDVCFPGGIHEHHARSELFDQAAVDVRVGGCPRNEALGGTDRLHHRKQREIL